MRVRYAVVLLLSAVVFAVLFVVWLNAPTGPLHTGPDQYGRIVPATIDGK